MYTVFLFLAAFLLTGCTFSPDDYIVIDDLPNPGRGWTTHYSFNSDERNLYYPDSTIAYIRYTWAELEPAEGEINFYLLDTHIEEARDDGQKMAFRVMPDNSGSGENGVPEWLIDKGVGGVHYQDSVTSTLFMPDFEDPVFLDNAHRLIAALGERYNGDPAIDHVDIGMVGHWGEWHVSGAADVGAELPSLEVMKEYIDMHCDAFPDTPLIMLLGDVGDDGAAALSYALDRGTGWRADCWGDYRSGWNHMEDHYPLRLDAASAHDAWKTAPVALETCGIPRDWQLRFPGRLDEILQFAVDNHVSILNGKSSRFPAVWLDEFSTFTRRIGYRFSFEAGSVPSAAEPGESLSLSIHWSNSGNAPVYIPYIPTLRLLQDENEILRTESGADVTAWLPGGPYTTDFSFHIPADGVSGRCVLEVGLTDPVSGEAVIAFDSDILPDGRWYPVGECVIE